MSGRKRIKRRRKRQDNRRGREEEEREVKKKVGKSKCRLFFQIYGTGQDSGVINDYEQYHADFGESSLLLRSS